MFRTLQTMLLKKTAVLLLALALLASCAQTETQEEKMLKGGEALVGLQQTIVEIAITADQFCTAGILDQDKCDNVSKAYNRAKVYYDLTATAYQTAINASDATADQAWARYEAVHANFNRLYADLLAIAAEYGIQAIQ